LWYTRVQTLFLVGCVFLSSFVEHTSSVFVFSGVCVSL
jgi:hypothetical protein